MVGQPGGLILSQNPAGGALVKENRKIYVDITKYNADEISLENLPPLYGTKYDIKSDVLNRIGIKTKVIGQEYDSGSPNHILRVSYEGRVIDGKNGRKKGVKIKKGSTLEFVVSKIEGGQVNVPDLVCSQYGGLNFLLQVYKLQLGSVENVGAITNQEKAYIISQFPTFEEGKMMAMGDKFQKLTNQTNYTMGDLTDQLQGAFGATFNSIGTFLPKLVSALIILFIGYIIAKIIKRVLTEVLRKVKFNDVADKVGVNGFMSKAGLKSDASGLMGKMLTLFFSNLGLPEVSGLLQQAVAFIPKLLVGCILLIVGMFAANFLRDMVVATLKGGGFESPNLVGNITYGAVMFLVVSMVLNQIGIGGDIVNTLVTSVLGGVSIATAIAFGLGGKDWAAQQIKNISKMD